MKGYFWGRILGRAIVTNGDFSAYVCYSAATQPCSQITLGRLVDLGLNLYIVFVLKPRLFILSLWNGDGGEKKTNEQVSTPDSSTQSEL